jgi:hypothetical protein
MAELPTVTHADGRVGILDARGVPDFRPRAPGFYFSALAHPHPFALHRDALDAAGLGAADGGAGSSWCMCLPTLKSIENCLLSVIARANLDSGLSIVHNAIWTLNTVASVTIADDTASTPASAAHTAGDSDDDHDDASVPSEKHSPAVLRLQEVLSVVARVVIDFHVNAAEEQQRSARPKRGPGAMDDEDAKLAAPAPVNAFSVTPGIPTQANPFSSFASSSSPASGSSTAFPVSSPFAAHQIQSKTPSQPPQGLPRPRIPLPSRSSVLGSPASTSFSASTRMVPRAALLRTKPHTHLALRVGNNPHDDKYFASPPASPVAGRMASLLPSAMAAATPTRIVIQRARVAAPLALYSDCVALVGTLMGRHATLARMSMAEADAVMAAAASPFNEAGVGVSGDGVAARVRQGAQKHLLCALFSGVYIRPQPSQDGASCSAAEVGADGAETEAEVCLNDEQSVSGSMSSHTSASNANAASASEAVVNTVEAAAPLAVLQALLSWAGLLEALSRACGRPHEAIADLSHSHTSYSDVSAGIASASDSTPTLSCFCRDIPRIAPIAVGTLEAMRVAGEELTPSVATAMVGLCGCVGRLYELYPTEDMMLAVGMLREYVEKLGMHVNVGV